MFVGCGCLFAEHGFEFGADASVGIALHPLVSEMVGYRYTFDNQLSLGAGIRLTENILATQAESIFYFLPYAHFGYEGFFFDGGAIISRESEITVTPYFAIGGRFGKWSIGPCLLDMSIALEISPRLVSNQTSNSSGTESLAKGIEAIFLTIADIPKIQVGAKLYLPL